MKPDQRFVAQPKHFWANVRTISQEIGYTEGKQVKVPTIEEMKVVFARLRLGADHIISARGAVTPFGQTLLSYFAHRAEVLNELVQPNLMDAGHAREAFVALRNKLKGLHLKCPIPMNKQKGKKKAPAYLTAIVNMLVETGGAGLPCDYDPRRLTTITRDGVPLRTLARRVDGAFLGPVNPIAVWEIKEYYYTTTFGSRVADGVYETLLDGMEIEELREHEQVDVKHYLMVDGRYTWWDCGRSYLCRIVDMLHMRYVDEVLFGREVIERLPGAVLEWVEIARVRGDV